MRIAHDQQRQQREAKQDLQTRIMKSFRVRLEMDMLRLKAQEEAKARELSRQREMERQRSEERFKERCQQIQLEQKERVEIKKQLMESR